MSNFCCPHCGNPQLQVFNETNTQTTGKGYSSGKGCLGYLLLGPLGLLCGSCGSGQKTTTTNTTYWICPKCGNRFRAPDDIRKEISTNNHKFVAIMICAILIVICGLVFFISPYDTMNGFGVFVELIAALVFIMCIVIKSQNKKLEKEVYDIEQEMQHFNR